MKVGGAEAREVGPEIQDYLAEEAAQKLEPECSFLRLLCVVSQTAGEMLDGEVHRPNWQIGPPQSRL